MRRRDLLARLAWLPLIPAALRAPTMAASSDHVAQMLQRYFGRSAKIITYTRESIAWSRGNVPGSRARLGDGWIEVGGRWAGYYTQGGWETGRTEFWKVVDRAGRVARVR